MRLHIAFVIATLFCFDGKAEASGTKCVDYVYKCPEYKSKGWCAISHKNNGYMKNMCKWSCGFCGAETTTNPPSPVQTTKSPLPTTHPSITTSEGFPPKSTVSPGPCSLPDVASGRVIAGSDAKLGQFPWQVAIYQNGYFICGGSIIKPDWIVTAAHCLYDIEPTENVTVVAGDFDRVRRSGFEQVSELEIPHIHPHYYEPMRMNNDVALMKLKTPFKLGKYVQTVCIPHQDEELPAGSKCFLSGWGKTHKDGVASERLQFATLYSMNHTECERYNYRVSRRMLCGYNANNIKAAGCDGDSGGPLVCQGSDGGWKLHGLVSWGANGCDTKYKYTVFARMSKFRYFINDTLGLIPEATLPPPPPGGCNADVPSAAAFKFSMTSSSPGRQTCGISNPVSGRVIAGQKSKPGQFPWQVALYKKNWIRSTGKYETKFQCGGSLIAPNWVLTAAHCVYRSYAHKFNASVGVVDRRNPSKQIIPVEKIITFPKYKKEITLNNDIALLKLSDPIMIGPLINTICLPNQEEEIAVGSKCFVSGWGKTESKPFVVDELQHASLQILSNKECYRRQWRINEVTDKMVCAAAGKGCPQSACQGDSGGPLVCQLPSGRWIQHGIVSWGSPYCDTNEASSVFTRVSEFRDWIEEMKIKYD